MAPHESLLGMSYQEPLLSPREIAVPRQSLNLRPPESKLLEMNHRKSYHTHMFSHDGKKVLKIIKLFYGKDNMKELTIKIT